ncbi:hypothetical protein BGZ94_001731 [Podila epigama]|nr:hypothetical protein BGZ94_001731 [Podila epigama]
MKDSGFSARSEAVHLVKGFLGFKTYRYKEPSFVRHEHNGINMRRPTIATVGVVQDEQQSILRMALSFGLLVVMAIIRCWLCLTPLLCKPLFDTVHSCPHPHPYPYPEEIEEERREHEVLASLPVEMEPTTDATAAGRAGTLGYGESDKVPVQDRAGTDARLQQADEREQHKQRHHWSSRRKPRHSSTEQLNGKDVMKMAKDCDENTRIGGHGEALHEMDDKDVNDATMAEEKEGDGGGGDRYKFFQRVGELHRRRGEIVETMVASTAAIAEAKVREVREVAITTTLATLARPTQTTMDQDLASKEMKVKKMEKLGWRARRRLRKAEERRQAVIRSSQDIGRYSLLYEMGTMLWMDGWKRAVLVPTKIEPEAYED